jgi:hypothetical protein
MANQFIEEARKSMHKFKSAKEEAKALIYNDSPVPDPNHYFEQVYIWVR